MDLILTLGHNSSAIVVDDGRVLGGYEEERFTGVKSDSIFPHQSIGELMRRFKFTTDTDIYVGHWFLDAKLPIGNKYWDPSWLQGLFPNGEVHSLSQDLTHHDSHLESAIVFAGPEFTNNCMVLVADGFGSFGECITLYSIVDGKRSTLKRVFGFEKSLGMLYQYATAFMNMKMHNHEYKMLAYEVHLDECGIDKPKLDVLVQEHAQKWLQRIFHHTLSNQFDPITAIDALPRVQQNINNLLLHVLEEMFVRYADTQTMRCVISYFVQNLVEAVILTIVKLYNPGNLLVAGGLFYNVKLNSLLAKNISGKLCAMPLAGDQGAGLGVYQAYKGDLIWPDNLFWGHRNLAFDDITAVPDGVVQVQSMDDAMEIIQDELDDIGFVNLVRGAMEFGPRALCNTTTLARPEEEVAQTINRINARTMEMPFAPVVTQKQADEHFKDCDHIHKSLEYMIVTRDYKPGHGEKLPGAAHHYPDSNVYTGRPQITSDQHLVQLLDKNGLLINTSFNFHGVPIVRSKEQIIHTHVNQRKTAEDIKALTIIVKE